MKRPSRWLVAAGALGATLAGALVWIASPSNDWYLPGQSIAMRNATERHVNGATVWIDVTSDGVAMHGDASSNLLTTGATADLPGPFALRLTSVNPPPAGEAGDGGIGTATFTLVWG